MLPRLVWGLEEFIYISILLPSNNILMILILVRLFYNPIQLLK